MQLTLRQWIVAGIGFVVAVLAFFAWSYRAQVPSPVAPSDITASSTENGTPVATTTVVYTGPFPINSADTIVSWSFKGAYTGNEALIAKANADTAYLTGLIGKGEYDDYDLYLGIGNNESSLGDGKSAYDNYNRAIRIHPTKGLALANLGHLFDQLGAYNSAADAYAKATAVEPGMLEYHIERLNYLTRQFPNDPVRITAALTDVSKVFGDTAQILAIEAQWLTELKRYTEATTAWETVKMLSPGKDTAAIDAEIARLQAKQ